MAILALARVLLGLDVVLIFASLSAAAFRLFLHASRSSNHARIRNPLLM